MNLLLRTFGTALSVAALFILADRARAASVSAAAGYTNDFAVQPPAADWATFSRAGGAADNYDTDGDVNANITASAVNAQTTANATVPAIANGGATWSSTNFYLQTRPTGNRYTALMGKFVNNTGTNATQVTLSYLFTIAAGPTPEDSGKGTRAYFSLTGLTNSWTNLATLNSLATNNGSSTLTTNLPLNWAIGASLFLLWTDDNASAPMATTDPANQIDNFSLQVTAGAPLNTNLSCLLTAPTNNAVLVSDTPIAAAAAVANGTAPHTVQYFTNSGAGNTVFAPAGSSTTPPFNVSVGSLPAGTYNLYAVVTDSAGTPASTNSMTNTFVVANPISFALTAPAPDATFDNVTSVTGRTTVSGGTAPYSVQFYLDNTANGSPVTSEPYERNFGALFVGDHTIRATVTDARGWVSNSLTSLVHINGPLAVTLLPTNGASFIFGQAVTLAAAPGGGTGPYSVTFSSNGQVLGSLGSSPFTTNLGVLPVGSYTSYVHVSDSSLPVAQEANSSTNVVTVLPNPLVVNLTSPTSGQNVTAGAALALAATATVGLPLTVTNVQFFYDATLAGTDSTAPYSGSVTPAVGTHAVYAAATDNLGRRNYSATNQFTATAPTGNNDNFVNAIPLFGPIVTTTGNNIGATKQFGQEPTQIGGTDFSNFGGASVWWTWTATASGPTTIDTEGSSFNTLLGVYTGNAAPSLTLVADNNDYNGNTWSRVQFNAVAGTVYRILVDGLRSGGGFGSVAMGNIVLHIMGVGGLTINTPTNGMVVTVGEAIPISVTIDADFPNPPASRVDFYHGGSLFGSSSNAPFSAIATNWPVGSNSFYVVAIDSTGAPIQSGVINVLVQNIGVTLLSPAEDTVFLNAIPIPVLAWSYLPAGSITNVEFFVDGVKFGEDATAPLSAVWGSVVGGSHRLTAIGQSDTGRSYNSQPVNIGVATTLIATGSVWKYLDNGSDQGTGWIAANFDDGAWASGPAELGYGDGDEATVVQDNPTPGYGQNDTDRYITTYFRRSFVVSNAAGFAALSMALERDDGAVVYLNGREVFRTANMPAAPAPITYTTVTSDGIGIEDTIDNVSLNATNFIDGTNVFAVEIHQQAANSSDISFNLQLVGLPIIIHNLYPLVALTGPTNSALFLSPAPVLFEATASDLDGFVSRVEFLADGVKIGEDTNAPYSADWINPPVGPHALTAVAIDDQGGRQESAAIAIDVYDSVGTPFARITGPSDGSAFEGGTNLILTAYANAPSGVTNVQFFGNGLLIGSDGQPPYRLVWDAPFGTNLVAAVAIDANGVRGTSAVVRLIAYPNSIAPVIVRQSPVAGASLTNLTSLSVTFSEPVHHVDAADLLVGGVAATGVTGSNLNYVFTFPQPPYGEVSVGWAGGHGISDFGFPSDLLFNELGAGAQWVYQLIDKTPPAIAAKIPAAGALITNLAQISVFFTEPVSGVDAADLLVAGVPATGVTGSGSNYIFTVIPPAPGTINITWSTNHGIADVAVEPNAFNRTGAGATWNYTLDNRVVLIASNSNWRLVKGLAEASEPAAAWRQPGFDDSSWSNAPAPFYFGDPYTNALIQGTLLSDMLGNYTTIFLRKEFTVDNRGAITNLLLNHQSDDGFIAWLNGIEVLRFNVPGGQLPYTATAVNAANEPAQAGAAYIIASLTNAAVSRLVNGTNILAIQALNQNLTNSTDFGFNAQLYFFPVDVRTVPPRLIASEPAPGDIFYLTNVTINFSEGVSGVEAGDLLVNGLPATALTSTTNSSYSFSFPQPPYGPVLITWDTNHGIVDFDTPARAFDGAAASARVSYTLLNPSSPRIVTQSPPASTTVTSLTAITLSFTEPVTGVEAADLLISGRAASAVASADNVTYTFTFPQPAFGTVTIRWTTNHGITDLEVPAASFDPTRFGGQWNYTLINPVPTVTMTSPTNGTYVLENATVILRATASDNDGVVSLVEFFSGATKLGEGTNAPYTLAVSNLALGTYLLRAVATDNVGFRGTSAPVVLNVVTSLPIYLVRGPYLQIGSPTGGVVRWRTDQFSDAAVYYGTDLNNLTNIAVETSLTNEHIVALGGLQPDTRYYYSIGSSGQRLVGGTNDGTNYWFKSSPPVGSRQPVRFWALGDAGTAGNGAPDRQASTRDAFYNFAATNGQTDLMLMLGDNAYNSGTDSEHQAAVFDMYPTTLRNKFLWPTIGNHETSQSTTATDFPYLNIFSLPQSGEAGGLASGTEKYYSFDYANVHFVCLDAMTSGRTATSPMAQWLVNDLEATAQDWIVVFFHHSLYTKGTHDSDSEGDLVELRQNIIPILETHSVDIVLMGHSHVYERSYLLDGHYGLSSTFTDSMKIDGGTGREEETGAYTKNDEGRGVVYTIAGSAGQALGGPLNHPAHFFSINELGTVVVDVSSNRLDALFLNSSGVTRDHYTLIKAHPLPSTPLNLVAIPTAPSDITLAWTHGGRNQLGFWIERSLDGVNFSQLLSAPAEATNSLDSGLLTGVTYYYRLRATNTVGLSDYSTVASATIVVPTGPPNAPAALTVSSDNGVEFYRSQMLLRWQDRSTNEGAFQIERSLDGSFFMPIGTVAANITHYVDRDLANGTPYYYQVRAFNSLGVSTPTVLAGDITHPQSQVVLRGASATFHAGVEGQAPVSYQWQYLGAPITGQTNESLVLNNVQTAHEGDYSVVVTDAAGQLISNPAYLLVVAPPRIVVQPPDRTNLIATSVSLSVVADGTDPFIYRWRKNGAPLAGANSPTLTLTGLQLSDQAGYDVIVENDFGAVTSRLAQVIVIIPPFAATVPDMFAEVLKTLTVSHIVSDPNDPPLKLAYSLAPGAPTNATIDPIKGVFRWTPQRDQAPGTNLFTVRVLFNSLISNAVSFTVFVNDYNEVAIGSTNVLSGGSNSVPIDLFSSSPLMNFQCSLTFPGDRLTNMRVESLSSNLASMAMELTDANTAALTFTPTAGTFLQGTQRIARLYFKAVTNPISAFLPLQLWGVSQSSANVGQIPTSLIKSGRVVVVGAKPLLEVSLSPTGQRSLTLYGKAGTNYTVQQNLSLTNANTWTFRGLLQPTTNLSRTVSSLGIAPGPEVFYRARE